jgi:hypothetical protein
MEKPNTSQGNPLDKENIYETLFVFIDNVLFQYSTSKTGENDITQDMEISLNEETRVHDTCFAFQNQYQKGNATTDIGVYIRSNRYVFCWIEAKRLPTPKVKDRDEREYVFVSQEKENGKKKFRGNGGIQRFKESKYAPNLPYSIMIGYIQDNNEVDYWLSKINTWVTDLAATGNKLWTNEDCLNKYVSNKCYRFLSTHKRKDETTIILHHYWKIFNVNQCA